MWAALVGASAGCIVAGEVARRVITAARQAADKPPVEPREPAEPKDPESALDSVQALPPVPPPAAGDQPPGG